MRRLVLTTMIGGLLLAPGCTKAGDEADQHSGGTGAPSAEEAAGTAGMGPMGPAAPGDPQAGKAVAKTYLAHLSKGEFAQAEALQDAKLKQLMPQAKLKTVWAQVTAKAGAFQEVQKVETQTVPNYTRVQITAKFSGAALYVRIPVNAQGQVAGLFFAPAKAKAAAAYQAPAYAKPGAFTEKTLSVGDKEWALGASLTLPVEPAPGKLPAVVLVHGSGPHDRDETIGPNKPFKDLALGLASRGIAVLRYDKRTRAHGAKFVKVVGDKATGREIVVDDAARAVAALRTQPRIDPQRLFVLGHSMGGYFGPRIAAKAQPLAGLIVLAGNSRPLEDLILEQFTYVANLPGPTGAEAKKKLAGIKVAVARVKAPKLAPDTPKDDLPLAIPAAFWLDVRGYHPPQAAKKLPARTRLLILGGGRDYQVTQADFDGWKKGLAGRAGAAFKWYPALNHLFVKGQGKATPEEYAKPGHVAGSVIEDLAAFILKK